jgi:hypothetical protein
MIVLSIHAPIKHHNNKLFMENVNPKYNQKKEKRKSQISNFKMKIKPKIKIFTCKLYPFNIDVYFKYQNTTCTLLEIVYIIQVLKTWDFLKQYN